VTYKGEPLVKGMRVTGFTNGEESEMQLTHVVPFLVEDELLRLGAEFAKLTDWDAFAITAGRLITGKNPAASTSAAKALLELLDEPAASCTSLELSDSADAESPDAPGFSIQSKRI
jgi:putative intracellular protease/amidase